MFVYFISNHRSRRIVDHGVSTKINLKYSSYVENSWVISIVPSMIIVTSVLPVKYMLNIKTNQYFGPYQVSTLPRDHSLFVTWGSGDSTVFKGNGGGDGWGISRR